MLAVKIPFRLLKCLSSLSRTTEADQFHLLVKNKGLIRTGLVHQLRPFQGGHSAEVDESHLRSAFPRTYDPDVVVRLEFASGFPPISISTDSPATAVFLHSWRLNLSMSTDTYAIRFYICRWSTADLQSGPFYKTAYQKCFSLDHGLEKGQEWGS